MGEIVVYAPTNAALDTILERINRRGSWVFRELDRIAARPPATPERRYLSGETHQFLGKQYRLSIEPSDVPQVKLAGQRINILARQVFHQAHCRRLLDAFYKVKAREIFNERLNAVIPPFIRKGMRRPSLIVRKMSRRWGSFTAQGRIVLNVDLVRASPLLIDYVICHELAHAFHPDHGKEWRNLFDAVLPDWESRKARLEAFLR